jgi:FixJ family two-component response regulator
MSEIKKHSFDVLFVDDEEQTRKYFKMGLKTHFEIHTAASVAEAKEILQNHSDKIGVVITDQRMPGGNGVELLRFLKSHHPRIVRLLATAYSDLAEAIEAVNSGEIFRYIQKPWKDFDSLKMELSQAMELFETKQQRDELLREKFTIRKKMTKVERIRLLSTITTALGSRFEAIQELLKILVEEENQDEVILENLDFGKQEIVEAKFQLNLIESLKNQMTILNGHNLDKATIDKLLQVNASDDGEIKFAINLKENSNFLITSANNFKSDNLLNLLALCLFVDQKNATIVFRVENESLNCQIKIGNKSTEANNLENIILLALLA